MKDIYTELIIEAAYKWRAADVHAAACRLGIREDKTGCADDVELEKLSRLRSLLDSHKSIFCS